MAISRRHRLGPGAIAQCAAQNSRSDVALRCRGPHRFAQANVTGQENDELERALAAASGARALLSSPAHWTRGALARDRRGREVLPDDAAAVRWCVNGALLCAGARLDRRRLRYRKGADTSTIGIADLVTTASGRLAARQFGAFLVKKHRDAGHAFLIGDRPGPQASLFEVLPEPFNDRKPGGYRSVAAALDSFIETLERARTDAAPPRRARSPRRRRGEDAGAA